MHKLKLFIPKEDIIKLTKKDLKALRAIADSLANSLTNSENYVTKSNV